MKNLPKLLLFSTLFLITPLAVSVKMAAAFSAFKIITLGLKLQTIDSAKQQGRLFLGWLTGWVIATQNLNEFKNGDYSHFFTQLGLNVLWVGSLAYAAGMIWFKVKQSKNTEPLPIEPQPATPRPTVLQISAYLLLLVMLLSVKTGIAQYQLATAYQRGSFISQNREKAQFWLKKAADLGHEQAKQQLDGN
ncbi:MAG: SEL1-like repeat protein [Methylomonas sp.]